jgi:DNA-binding MarR family transcriptional regulator
MSRFVDRLEHTGVVCREAVPSDRRAFHIVITEEGVALLRRTWPIYAMRVGRHSAPYIEEKAAAGTMFEQMADSARPGSEAAAALSNSS